MACRLDPRVGRYRGYTSSTGTWDGTRDDEPDEAWAVSGQAHQWPTISSFCWIDLHPTASSRTVSPALKSTRFEEFAEHWY